MVPEGLFLPVRNVVEDDGGGAEEEDDEGPVVAHLAWVSGHEVGREGVENLDPTL